MRHFEDLKIGEYLTSEYMTVELDDMLAFAEKYDPQWFHTDVEAAKDTRFGEVIASGVYVAALWRRLDHTLNGDVNYICGVGWENVRWAKAMRAGDVIRATSELLELRDSGADPTRGIVVYMCRLENNEGETMLQFRSTALVNRAPTA